MATAFEFKATDTRVFCLDADEVKLHMMSYDGNKWMWQLEVNGDKCNAQHIESNMGILMHKDWYVAWTFYLPILQPFKVRMANVHFSNKDKPWVFSERSSESCSK